MRYETVAQHEVRGNRSKQLLVDPEIVHVDELPAIARRKGPGAFDLGRPVFRGLYDQLIGIVSCHSASVLQPLKAAPSSKSGMYRARTTAAMTTPMTTRITGSINVMNRATSVSISSS